MPYTYDNYPTYLKKYPEKIRHQWINVFNNVHKKTKSEKRAFKAANSVLKNRVKKNKDELSQSQKFNYTVDLWLGKLDG